ncbi:MAG: hypothetical protein DRP00_01925 [Candidatus Aenigmatarchaeota archaeon]|nr:MAG: hypothetical protein DRP00_01925 [Candidatus Aenigmarchaeota archaeon]
MEKIVSSFLVVILALILLSIFLTASIQVPTSVKIVEKTRKIVLTNFSFPKVSLKIPAVDNKGNGVVTTLKVEAKPGEGRTLVNIDQLLFWIDTQHSIRLAKRVAENVTGIDLSHVDLVYAIETNASIIEGPSAGAAITVATIAAIENRTINESVMMTGTINHDGTIGPVGGIVAKAKAAKDVGAKLFLVPEGQAVQTYYEPEQHCEKFGFITYCTTEYKPKKIDVGKEVGIEVKEVSTIQEALKYFLLQ